MVEPYGHVVSIVDTVDEFVAACDLILQRTPAEQAAHARALADVVSRTSWDRTAHAMAELIADADAEVDNADFVESQPMADDAAPRDLADATRAVSVVAASESKRASAAG